MAAEPLSNEPRHDADDATTGGESALWTSRPSGTRRADRQDRVVQSMARKVTRPCRRNSCPAPARASMILDYAGKCVTLVPLLDQPDPRFLEVCPAHAASMEVPRGWELVDERDDVDEPSGPPTAHEMGSSATVAVLAEALRHDDLAPDDRPQGDEDVGADAAGDVVGLTAPDGGDVSAVDDVGLDGDAVDEVAGEPDEAGPRRRQLRLAGSGAGSADGGDGSGSATRRPRPVPASIED